MRAGVSLSLRVATAVAFGATAALAVTVSKSTPLNAALASDKGAGVAHAAASPRPTAVTARCAAAGLRISLGSGAEVGAAVTRYRLEFTNVSGAPCTLAGYPEVTAYRGDDVRVGPAAARYPSGAARRVLLAPGQSAHAVLDAAAPAARCHPFRASGLRVVAPDETDARYVRSFFTACAARAVPGKNYLLVHAIQPGVGTAAGVTHRPGTA
jgi:hypothetical protein